MRNSLAIILAAALAAVTPALAEPVHFHPPQTEQEQALDKMLHATETDGDALAQLLGRPGAKGHLDYARILTPKVIASIRKAERALVRQDCGGKYRKDEVCGIDFDPITCAQDSSPAYLYHTILDLGPKVVIEYKSPDQTASAAVYTLVKAPDGWRIDGITCATGDKYN
jgi:hypothetical protein